MESSIWPIFKFIPKEEFLKGDNLLYVETSITDMAELNKLALSILNAGHKPDYKYYDATLDYKTPGIGAFRINSEDSEIMKQVQVHKNPKYPNLFQLDMYEKCSTGMLLKQIGICDLSDYDRPLVEVIYSTLQEFENNRHYSAFIGTAFQDIMIYLRPWDYSLGTKYLEIKNPISILEIPCPYGKN